jgi:2-polyprenyl-6-methoxyphenol hydroxylase-like FAD-dependent oxidoreductase
MRGAYVIAADGARSVIRKGLGIAFEGMTIPEIFLSMSTHFDFAKAMPDLAPIAYLTDPTEWAVLLRTPTLWRVLLPTDPGLSEAAIKDPATMQARLQGLCPNPAEYDIVHATAYRVHQRVAEKYTMGRCFLAGDSAHLNNPLGGMGMNGGVHDAVNLCEKLVQVWRGEAPLSLMERYERQRRQVCIDTVQAQTIRNRKMLAETDPAARRAHACAPTPGPARRGPKDQGARPRAMIERRSCRFSASPHAAPDRAARGSLAPRAHRSRAAAPGPTRRDRTSAPARPRARRPEADKGARPISRAM